MKITIIPKIIFGIIFTKTYSMRKFIVPIIDGSFLAASRFAWPIADAAEDAREDVRLPVQHVGVGETALCDQPYVARHIGVCGTGPLAVDDFVKVIRIGGISWLHSRSFRAAVPPPGVNRHCRPFGVG